MTKANAPVSRGVFWAKDYLPRGYHSWRQVAEYFDGDGAVYVSIRKYVLKIRLSFYDVWKPQLEAIRTFLESKGIRPQRLGLQRKEHADLWNLTLGDHGQVRRVIHEVLPFACKKRGDLLVALNYLEDRITAKEAITQLNRLVREKRRSGYIRSFNLRLKWSEGARKGRRLGAEAGAIKVKVQVPPEIQRQMRIQRSYGISLQELHRKYGYTVRVIRRILGT